MYSYNSRSSDSGKQYVALSTQSIGVGTAGTVNMVARVSLVDYRGTTIIDTYVRPTLPVESYRTAQTGITARDVEQGVSFEQARSLLSSSVSGKIIVGHQLWEDLSVMGITHPAFGTRDAALFFPYRSALRSVNNIVGLSTLMFRLMGREIAVEHQDSLENARAVMDLYRTTQDDWEGYIDDGEWPCALPPRAYSRCYS